MSGNGESRARGPGSLGFGSPTGSTSDIPPARGSVVSTVQRADDGVLTEEWLRRNGHPLAAAERARQKEIARVRLDRLLGVDGSDREPPQQRWECPGMFGPAGQWVPCCRGDAA